MRAPLSCTPKLRYLDYTVANAALKLLKETCRVRVRGVYVPCKNSSPHGRCGAFGGAVPAVRGVRYHTVPYMPRILVFTSMMLRVLTQQPLAVMELEFIFLSWDWFPSMYVLFDLDSPFEGVY